MGFLGDKCLVGSWTYVCLHRSYIFLLKGLVAECVHHLFELLIRIALVPLAHWSGPV